MNFVLLGDEPKTEGQSLIKAIAKDDRHTMVRAIDVVDDQVLRSAFPGIELSDDWESLLCDDQIEMVIVGDSHDKDRRADQLRKLIQSQVPLAVFLPMHDSVLLAFELDMIRRETNAIVVPIIPWRWHPAFEILNSLITAGGESSMGRVEQTIFQRPMANRTKVNVCNRFAADIDLLRGLCGQVTALGAVGGRGDRQAADADATYANLNVSLSCTSGIGARWFVSPGGSDDPAQLTVLGNSGKTILRIPTDDSPWTMQSESDGEKTERRFENWNWRTAALDEFQRAMDGGEPSPDWDDAARAGDLADTIRQSLSRGRAIPLDNELHTEERSFKGLMGITGCGLLLFALGGTGVVAAGQKLAHSAKLDGLAELLGKWPQVLLLVMVVFLLLQLLRMVFPNDKNDISEKKNS